MSIRSGTSSSNLTDFIGNKVGNGLGMAYFAGTRSYLARVWALGWEARPLTWISNPTHGRPIFYFWRAQTVFFVKQLHGAHFSMARNLRAVIVDHLRTTYHIPYARKKNLGTRAASGGVPPNPLETDRI